MTAANIGLALLVKVFLGGRDMRNFGQGTFGREKERSCNPGLGRWSSRWQAKAVCTQVVLVT